LLAPLYHSPASMQERCATYSRLEPQKMTLLVPRKITRPKGHRITRLHRTGPPPPSGDGPYRLSAAFLLAA